MNKQQIGTKLTLDALGVPLSLGTFDERLTIQKSVYLAKAAGHDCGHYFRWYLRGPYSPELTRDAFSIAAEVAEGVDESSGWALDQASEGRLQRVKRLVSQGETGDPTRRLELLASVHFLVDRNQVPGADVDAVTKLLKRYGKDFSEREVADALSELRCNELLRA